MSQWGLAGSEGCASFPLEVRPARDDETLLTSRPQAGPLPIVLTVRGGTAEPAQRLLESGGVLLGAGASADVIIDDPRVSRSHARIELVAEGVEVTDLDSTNGTFYQGTRIHRVVLPPGSRIQVGDSIISIDPDLTQLETPSARERLAYRGLLGRSKSMLDVFSKLSRLEGSLVNVLVHGESGVGKELIAKALHQGSALCDGPFVLVNCASLRGDLARSELFGHRKGAFTGAVETRVGALELADGGTLFLDEIGELPLDVQPLLLRALETGDVQRVGEQQVRQVRVRVIAATHRDLRSMTQSGEFREDLYFRLAVVTLNVPPLRERPEDIPLLANHFARHTGLPELPEDILAELGRREWRGNGRELRNAVHAYRALGTLDPQVKQSSDELESFFRRISDPSRSFQEQKQLITDTFGRVFFERLLEECGGNRSEAARRMGMDRSYFGKLLGRYGVGDE